MLDRRTMIKGTLGALAAPMINRGRFRLFAQSTAEYSARAIALVEYSAVDCANSR